MTTSHLQQTNADLEWNASTTLGMEYPTGLSKIMRKNKGETFLLICFTQKECMFEFGGFIFFPRDYHSHDTYTHTPFLVAFSAFLLVLSRFGAN
jgi:hypothetical protein